LGTIIDGKRVALKITDQVRSEVAVFVAQNGRVPGLATVLVGENPASQVYIKNKIQTAGKCGIQSFHHQLDVTITQKELLTLIEALNGNQEVDGILVQSGVGEVLKITERKLKGIKVLWCFIQMETTTLRVKEWEMIFVLLME